MPSVAGTPPRRPCALLPLALLLLAAGALPAPAQPELGPDELAAAARQVRALLAPPGDKAYRQVLTGVEVRRDPTVDTAAVYDIAVRYDPLRYRAPFNGRYPLAFSDQFVSWGKRLALYTRSVPWRSGRFFLHDLSGGREAWIPTWDARQLFPGGQAPPAADSSSTAWLEPYAGVPAGTPLELLGQWLARMRPGGPDALYFRATTRRENGP